MEDEEMDEDFSSVGEIGIFRDVEFNSIIFSITGFVVVLLPETLLSPDSVCVKNET